MKKNLSFIRHAKTRSALEKRYSAADEPLCAAGSAEALALCSPDCDLLFVGGALRCRQTAEIVFPKMEFREIDFGIFGGKTSAELENSPEYNSWLDTYCMGAIPGGDDVFLFKEKCVEIFFAITRRPDFIAARNIVFVIHGGNIMALMEKLQGGSFFDYYLPPCGVVSFEYNL